MSFRARLTLLAAVAIAVIVAGASLAVWAVASHQLRSQVDSRALVDETEAAPRSHGPYGPFRTCC